MSLINTIREDQITARKARLGAEATTLTTLLGEALIVGKNDAGRETTDDEVIAVVKKFMKNNKELADAVDPTSAAYNNAMVENELLSHYLPQQLSKDELRAIILPLADGKTMKDMGGIMKELKTKYTGLYDGSMASSIIKSMLK